MAGSAEAAAPAAQQIHRLTAGWEVTRADPDQPPGPAGWLPARVPGTAAAALLDAGAWRPGQPSDLDASDWWFRTRFPAAAVAPDEQVVLALDGIATVAEVHLNGTLVATSESMFLEHRVDVGALLRDENELTIRCRALAPLLAARRRPRARWRTRVADGNLRFFRTSLLGRAPGFAPGPAPVGPWRPVALERRRRLAVESLVLRPSLAGADGVVAVRAAVRPLGGAAIAAAELEVTGPGGRTQVAPLAVGAAGEIVALEGEVVVPDAPRWWPHTHGAPVLHEVRLRVRDDAGEVDLDAGRVGFRELAAGPRPEHDVAADGLDLHVNGVRIFARGAVWTPADPVALAADPAALLEALERVRDAGMNLLRVPGIGAYESDAFHDRCDELGLLVWQDLMFANFDYPAADPGFRALVGAEVRRVLERIGARPSTAIVCGGSEVEQQAAMVGLDPAAGRGELFGELLPGLVEAGAPGAVWVPSAPSGGDLPFRPGAGVANYYGVGAYGLPLEDARRSGVRFAAECLAFANVPDEAALEALAPDAPGHVVVSDPRWKAGVPRDQGASWDFDDVRDRYLALLFGADPAQLRRTDPERYLELSRATSGEVMAEVLGEWRRAGSPCGGGLVLWLRDLAPGAGWGVLDHRGRPKPAYHHLRRALAPIAVWTSDEQLGGIVVHVANDPPDPLEARLRVALYADGERRVEEVAEDLVLAGHETAERNVEAMLGRFVDASWAYRFGPPGHDAIVASLERGGELLSQAVRFPAGRPLARESAARLGLDGALRRDPGGEILLTVRARRLVYGLRIHGAGIDPSDDAFTVEPGGTRTVALGTRPVLRVELSALNLHGRVAVRPAGEDG